MNALAVGLAAIAGAAVGVGFCTLIAGQAAGSLVGTGVGTVEVALGCVGIVAAVLGGMRS